MVEELVKEADKMDAAAAATAAAANAVHSDADVEVVTDTKTALQIREEGQDGYHHHDIQPEYVTPRVAARNQRVVDASPSHRPSKRKKMRKRDHDRLDQKVLNPFHTSLSSCVVCKFFFKKAKPTKTARYCRECVTDPKWPQTCRAKGWQKTFHPRLCSK